VQRADLVFDCMCPPFPSTRAYRRSWLNSVTCVFTPACQVGCVWPQYTRGACAHGTSGPPCSSPAFPVPPSQDRREHAAVRVERGRAHPVHEEVGDAEADAVLRLSAAADGQELRAAHVVDAIAVGRQLRADLPCDAPPLQ
jgi:hypothetical protein